MQRYSTARHDYHSRSRRDEMGLRNLRVIAVALLVGCGSPNPSDAPTPCVQQPFRAELHVDAADDRQVWATHYDSGQEFVVRPHRPEVFVIDPARPTEVRIRNGDLFSEAGAIVQSACVDLASGAIFVGPADVPDPNRSPN